jgi:phosphoglycolate phosphatase-like HAD superfamily hydrolase
MGYDFKGNDEDIKALIGYPLDIMYKDLGIEDSKVWDFVDAYKNRYKDISTKKTLLLEKAYEAVELAASFARVSVVTTKTRKYTMPLLEHFDINKYFEIVTGRECVQNPKPHPEPILKTLADMNFDETKHDVWMIGDTKLDLICANESSINSVGVLCGYGSQEELLKYTKNIKNDAFDAVRYIKELNI